MVKFRGIRKAVASMVLCGAIICASSGGVYAASNDVEEKSTSSRGSVFTTQITEQDKKYIDEVQNDVPPLKAYEIDMLGNKTEVKPLSERESKSVDDLLQRSVPNDGYIYTLKDYDLDYNSGSLDKNYSKIGTVGFENRSTTKSWPLKYTQEDTSSSTWKVSGSLEVSGEAGVKFITKLTAKLGFSVAKDKTWSKSQTVENSLEIKPREWAQISKYVGGRQGNGALVYEKRSPGGSLLGLYYESAGGWAVSPTEINWVFNSGRL